MEELTWEPEFQEDWIDVVARREMAHADWNWGTSALILRPEEPLLPTRLEMRVSWYTPDHFDLAGVLWTAWPDLNYIRFRIHEVRSLYRIDQHNGHVTLLIRPHRWGLTFESRVIAVEVVEVVIDLYIPTPSNRWKPGDNRCAETTC